MNREFHRIAVVNRGEAALRFIRAVREFNQEHRTSLRTVALFAACDEQSLFVREANEAVLLQPASTSSGLRDFAEYFDHVALEKALVAAHADAVWPGWGFVSEHAEFADLCSELGVVFIGPSADTIRGLRDRIVLRRLADQLQLPGLPWSEGPVETLDDAHRHAEHLGYPLLLKASTRNGHGAVLVSKPEEMQEGFERARSHSFDRHGNPTIYMERLLQEARELRVDIVADRSGTAWALGLRQCTRTDRVAEAPPARLPAELNRAIRDAAIRISRAVGYTNVGCASFLWQPGTQQFAFLEMKASLSADHAVCESVCGVDLIKLQIQLAQGENLNHDAPQDYCHAIQAEIRAEELNDHPAWVERLKMATGPGIRIDSGVVEGKSLVGKADNFLSSVTACGQSRNEAVARLTGAIRDSVVVLRNHQTNKTTLLNFLDVMDDAEKTDQATREVNLERLRDAALIAAAVKTYETELARDIDLFYASAVRGRPQANRDVGKKIALVYQGQRCALNVLRSGSRRYRIAGETVVLDAKVQGIDDFEFWLAVQEERFHVVSVAEGSRYHIQVNGISFTIERGDLGVVRAPAPAVVVGVAVKTGDQVRAGDRLLVLEAMKLEMEVKAESNGWVRQVHVIPNMQVEAGVALLQIETDATTKAAAAELFPFSGRKTENCEPPVPRWWEDLQDLKQLVLGFDVPAAELARRFTTWKEYVPSNGSERSQLDIEVLETFVDIQTLFCRHPEPDSSSSAEIPSAEMCMFTYLSGLRSSEGLRVEEVPDAILAAIKKAVAHYAVASLDRTPALEESLFWIYKSHQRCEIQAPLIQQLLNQILSARCGRASHSGDSFRRLLDRLITITREMFPVLSELAREVRYRCFDEPLFEKARKDLYEQVEAQMECLLRGDPAGDRREKIRSLVECPQSLFGLFAPKFSDASPEMRLLMLEVLTWRYYRIRNLQEVNPLVVGAHCCIKGEYDHEGKRIHLLTAQTDYASLKDVARALFPTIREIPTDHDVVIDFYLWHADALPAVEELQKDLNESLDDAGFPRAIRRIVVAVAGDGKESPENLHFTYRPQDGKYEEEKLYRGLHPMIGKRLHLWRLSNFNIQRLPSVDDVYLIRGVARDNPKDERLFACAEVRDLTPVLDGSGDVVQLPYLERMLTESVAAIRTFQSRRAPHERLHWNRILLYVWPPLDLKPEKLHDIVQRLIPDTEGAGLEQVVVRARIPNPQTGELREMVVRLSSPGGAGLLMTFRPAARLEALKPLSDYEQKVVRMRQRGMIYPYEIVRMLTPSLQGANGDFPAGDFVEHDLNSGNQLVPVTRPHGQNKANIIVGVIRNFTERFPEGMRRVVLLGDPSKDLGALAEPECRRILAALDLAEEEHVPLEWFPISAGAKISMESGVENMDWIARVLRRLVEFTQGGGEVNLVVNGINVGAQPYWNAEATMLMHTRGILIMTPKAAMVLTGKRALDFSGSVSAEDNLGIGGYGRIMGVNGQGQYWARDIEDACHILLRHYEHTYIAPGESLPRRAVTSDPSDRDVRSYPHANGHEYSFTRIGDIFSDETNPGRKKSFDIRRVMMAVIDQDHTPLERWPGMRAAETTVIWDAHLGGYPVCLIGIESRQIPRVGFVPADGPEQWTAGTLFPMSSKKVARAINAASNNRPVVLLANLSGFDGSPESMRRLQLEYGAEIGRAVVNFKGPMAFCVINRYHGGAYVVFSRALNENLEVFALEGTYASVIGGAPAAAVVFAGEVETRARKDPRIQLLDQQINQADSKDKGRIRAERNELFRLIHSQKLGEVAEEFDRVHSVERARKVGALNEVIPAATLRPHLIQSIERGYSRMLSRSLKVLDASSRADEIREDVEAAKAS